MLEEALKYIELGWYVFPCHTPLTKEGWSCSCEAWRRKKYADYNCGDNAGKHPRTQHGLDDATLDPEQVREWWQRWPNANIGINCGLSGLLVIDLDQYKDIYQGHDLDLDEDTVTAITGGGGCHLFYKLEDSDQFGNRNKELPPGIDIRGHGGYVVAAPSLHKSGNHYQWELEYSPFDIELKPIPPKLREILSAGRSRTTSTVLFDTSPKYNGDGISSYGKVALNAEYEKVATAASGTRNNTLNDSAFAIGRLVAGGEIDYNVAFAQLKGAAMDAGLSDEEAEQTTESGMAAGMEHPRSSKPLDEAESSVEETLAVVECPDPALLCGNKQADEITTAIQEAVETKSHGKLDFNAMRKVFDMIAKVEDKYLRTHLRNTTPQALGIGKNDYDSYLLESQAELVKVKEKPDSWPYLIDKGIMQVMVKNKGGDYDQVPVAMFEAQITEQHISEYGQITYVITGHALRGGDFQVQIDADSFSNNQKLKAVMESAAGPHDPVMARMEPYLGPGIKMLSPESVKTIKKYERTGWAGGKFLIPGLEQEGTMIHLQRKMPYRVTKESDLDLGIAAFDALIKSIDEGVGPIVCSFLLQPPMAIHAGWRDERYGLFIRGRTGAQKSSTIQVGMCLYGPDFIRDDMLIKWGEGATRNAIMGYATTVHDVPFLVDNYKPNTGGGTVDFVNLIHNILEGGEKERMNRAAQLRDTKPIYAWPVFTGEDIPDSDAASLARILAVTFNRKTNTANLSEAQRLSPHLCAVGGAWIAWLETDEGKQAAKDAGVNMAAVRDKWAKMLIETQPNMANPYRVATNLATNQLVWETMIQHPILGKIALKYEDAHLQGLLQLSGAMSAYTTESIEALRMVELLRGLLASGRVILLGDRKTPAEMVDPVDRDRVVGWRTDDGGAYLLPDVVLASIKRMAGDGLNSISKHALYDQLEGLGLIATKDKDHTTKTIRLGGKLQKVLHLKSEAIDLEGDIPEGL